MLGDTSLLPTNMNYGNIDTVSLKRECSWKICPNVQNFCPNNGQFYSVGDATASPASPWRTLMLWISIVSSRIVLGVKFNFNEKATSSFKGNHLSFILFSTLWQCLIQKPELGVRSRKSPASSLSIYITATIGIIQSHWSC